MDGDAFGNHGKLLLPNLNSLLGRVQVSAVSADSLLYPCLKRPAYVNPYKGTPNARQRARWATWVSGNGLETNISFYNSVGDNVRVYNWSRAVSDDFEYDDQHNRIGVFRHRPIRSPFGTSRVQHVRCTGEPMNATESQPPGRAGVAVLHLRFSCDMVDLGHGAGKWQARRPKTPIQR